MGRAMGHEPAREETRDLASLAAAQNAVRGMLYGVALGDALGAPHEFKQVAMSKYTGRIAHRVEVGRRWGRPREGALGGVTDDTEMTLALSRALQRGRGTYRPDFAVAEYLAWGSSRCPFMGRNTRALFCRARTVEQYRARLSEIGATSQSNGCLMRAAPLAVLADWESAAREDCRLTNPHPVAVEATVAYVGGLRDALEGRSLAAIFERALAHRPSTAADESDSGRQMVRQVLTACLAAFDRKIRPEWHPQLVGDCAGWCLNALYCAFLEPARAFYHEYAPRVEKYAVGTFRGTVDKIVRCGGDTDTNASIAGALMGAHLGMAAMQAEPRTAQNIAVLSECTTVDSDIVRPAAYRPCAVGASADRLAAIAQGQGLKNMRGGEAPTAPGQDAAEPVTDQQLLELFGLWDRAPSG
jgi:ADP-ribosyl-[dinitrogen reductase] hydrolase